MYRGEGEMEKGVRTVMVLREPERISGPYGDEPITILTECMLHHIFNAVRLRRAPNHNVEPHQRLRRKEIRTESREVRPSHDAAQRGTLELMILATVGFRDAGGAEDERAVEVQHEELACGL
jgi:hypothetical protein